MSELAAAVSLVPDDSPRLRAGLGVVHGCAALLALQTCGLTPAGLLLAGALALHLLCMLDERRLQRAGLAAVLYDSAGQWHLQWQDGRREPAALAQGAVVSPWLTILCLSTPQGRIGLCVTPDVIADADFRRLRARLLWQRRQPARS